MIFKSWIKWFAGSKTSAKSQKSSPSVSVESILFLKKSLHLSRYSMLSNYEGPGTLLSSCTQFTRSICLNILLLQYHACCVAWISCCELFTLRVYLSCLLIVMTSVTNLFIYSRWYVGVVTYLNSQILIEFWGIVVNCGVKKLSAILLPSRPLNVNL